MGKVGKELGKGAAFWVVEVEGGGRGEGRGDGEGGWWWSGGCHGEGTEAGMELWMVTKVVGGLVGGE